MTTSPPLVTRPGTAPGDRRFRPDVEGLRAVAVLLVVLYHAGVPDLTGGYVGVDVFFVISGFVITGLLLRERSGTGRTSILGFYARRVRRILPAATLVIVVTVAAAYLVLGVVSGNSVADDGRWAAVFLANFHFESVGTNYFSAGLPPSPLQNFWSLSVEEQFYIVYPTLFLVVARSAGEGLPRTRLSVVLGVVIFASLLAVGDPDRVPPGRAYFSPFTRAWELALGGLVAVATTWLKHLPTRAAALLTWAGLAAIVYSAFAFAPRPPTRDHWWQSRWSAPPWSSPGGWPSPGGGRSRSSGPAPPSGWGSAPTPSTCGTGRS